MRTIVVSSCDSIYTDFVYYDNNGTSHPFPGSTEFKGDGCGNSATSLTTAASDGSGYMLTIQGELIQSLTTPEGIQIGTGSGQLPDRNGNIVSTPGSTKINNTLVFPFKDTLGTTVLTFTDPFLNQTAQETYVYTDATGAPATITIVKTTKTQQTNFQCPGISESGATSTKFVSEIDLPNGTKYSFTYEPTPGVPGSITGRIASITLPSGGTINYSYNNGNMTGAAASNGIVCADGSTAGITRQTPDGTWSYARSQISGSHWQTVISDPTGNQTVIDFQGIYETERKTYQGSSSGTLLSTVDTCYNGAASPCTGTAFTMPVSQRTITTTLPSAGSTALVTKNVATYNSVGGPTEIDEYAFGSGTAPSTPIRKTLITYASLGNITDFRRTVIVQDGSGNALSQSIYNYDETTPVAAPTGTPQLVSVTGSRGNLTSVQRCITVPTCSGAKSIMTYDTAGQLLTAKDPAGNQTTFSYADNYLDDNGANPPSATHTTSNPTDAFPTTITPPLNGALTSKYYYYNGALALSTDQNGNASFSHFDSLGRPTSSYGPSLSIAGGSGNANPWTLINYTSPTQVDIYSDINDSATTATSSCSVCRHDKVVADGLGRAINQQLVSDPEGATNVDTTYDARGQINTVSHAYRSTSDVTYGLETPSYDAAGRTIKILHPDGTSAFTYYGATVTANGGIATQLCDSGTYGLGFPVLSVDESGKKRQVWTDALGRTIEGDEPNGSGTLTSPICYKYDALGNLLQVVRTGTPAQTRTYAYDPLSRVTSVTIPERANSSGTNCAVTFTYDSNSNLKTKTFPTPNQNASCTNLTTITFNYDALNRLTSKTYSDTTPAVKYGYDAVALTGCATTPPTLTDSNPKGRMTAMCDSSGATSWAHDAAGRITTEKRIINGTSAVTQTISYAYNLDGSIYSVTYPSGKQVAYTVSNAQRYTAAKDPTSGGAQYAWTASYAAIGALQSMITGQVSGGFAGVTESHSYNKSLEYTTTKATSTAGTAMDLSLAYSLAGGDNGSVTTITNNADNGRSLALAYDPLNRISSAASQATSGADCWGQSFSPDALANLNSVTATKCAPPALSLSVDANNHINNDSTFAYDANGNMTNDGQSGVTYSFDDENHLFKITGISGGPWCYVYDGNGFRVAKKSGANSDCTGGTVTRLYWRSVAGDSLAETDSTGSTTNAAYSEYVFFAGRRVASRNGTGAIFYFFADQLGSTRTITTGNGPGQTPGQLCFDQDYTPYGQEIFATTQMTRLQTSACPPNYKFTGYERDSESGLDYAFARYYSSRLGRFLSTDPVAGSIGSLQSHNAYAYAINNPTNFVDPLGLDSISTNPFNRRRRHPRYPPRHAIDCAYDQTSILFGGGCSSGYGSDPFLLLDILFTQTGWRENPDCPNGDCGSGVPRFLPVFGNSGAYIFAFPGPGDSGSSGSGPRLRMRTQAEYHACLLKADNQFNSDSTGPFAKQVTGIVVAEGGIAVGWYALPAIGAAVKELASNPFHWEGMLKVAFVGIGANSMIWGAVPGYLYVEGTLDQSKVIDKLHNAEASCAGPVSTP